MKKILGTLALLSLVMVNAYAQKGWKWPADSATKIKAEEMNVIQSDAVKMGDYRGAIPALGWLIANAPDLNKSLYINGAKVYDNLTKVEQDPVRKVELADSLLWMYDKRIEHFGDKPNVLNRKVFKAYKYFIKDFSKSEWLLEMFDEAFDIGGSKILDANLVAYMNVIKVNAKLKKINEDDILVRYDKISEIIDQKLAYNRSKEKSNETLEKKKTAIDGILMDIVDINCEFVETNMAPKFDETPDDIKLVKRMFTFMLSGKCTDSPLFLSVSKQLQKMEPDYGLCKMVASKCVANKDYTSALAYYIEALELTEDGAKKSEIYVNMGKVYTVQHNKAKARAMYSNAIAADPANKDAYVAIGDLYYHSFSECKEEQDMVKDRLVFIAAYDMYKKGVAGAKMASSKEQFPSKEELFNGDYTVGQTLSIGCWINKSVVLQTRD
jgi:tetratricopeptide (TPR) repeat protein